MTTDLYWKRPGGKERNEATVVGAGRFGPSHKKEAAARRFGNCELWVFECCFCSGSAKGWEAGEVMPFSTPRSVKYVRNRSIKARRVRRTGATAQVWTQLWRGVS